VVNDRILERPPSPYPLITFDTAREGGTCKRSTLLWHVCSTATLFSRHSVVFPGKPSSLRDARLPKHFTGVSTCHIPLQAVQVCLLTKENHCCGLVKSLRVIGGGRREHLS
jgi:hypothetical protein